MSSKGKRKSTQSQNSFVLNKIIKKRSLLISGLLFLILGVALTLTAAAGFGSGDFSLEETRKFLGNGFILIGFALFTLALKVVLLGTKQGNVLEKEQGSHFSNKQLALIFSGFLLFIISAGTVILGILVNIYSLKILCQPWFVYYDPEIGICDCDPKNVDYVTADEPIFDLSAEIQPVRVAYIGDVSIKKLETMLTFISSEGADIIVINGDLTYYQAHEEFQNTIFDVLGEGFPVLITVGNHDTGEFTLYQEVALNIYNKVQDSYDANSSSVEKLQCSGVIGVNHFCSFRNIGFVLSGLGSTCMDDEFLEEELESQLDILNSSSVLWRNLFIHKNQKLLQTGDKADEVGWKAYELSIKYGTTVFNSHEHTYARTKELISLGEENLVSSDDGRLVVENTTTVTLGTSGLTLNEGFEFSDTVEVVDLGSGSTVVVANGLGGKDVRDARSGLESNSWWATTYNSNDRGSGATFGAHFCEYNAEFVNETAAYCYFKTLDDELVDEYILLNQN
eukprot:maker-scaffold_9-snap-gene-4.13-mRNA-1 protein AED:0.00 eAED:0.00 QI:191/1/1/1/1/1/4/95/507